MARKRDDRLVWAALFGLGLWAWTRKATASIGEILIIPEPTGPTPGVTLPSSIADHRETNVERGLTWLVWSEPSSPGFRSYHLTVRNSIGQLLAHEEGTAFWVEPQASEAGIDATADRGEKRREIMTSKNAAIGRLSA